jgi:hypothetical protein
MQTVDELRHAGNPFPSVHMSHSTTGAWFDQLSCAKQAVATMETVFQDANAGQEVEVQLSPLEQLRALWQRQAGFIPFVKQKRVIEESSEFLPYASSSTLSGWASPRAFAIQGLVVASAIVALLNWYSTRDTGKLQEEILALRADVQTETKRQQGIMDAAQAERKRILTSPKSIVWKTVPREQALKETEDAIEDSRKSLEEYKQRKLEQEIEVQARQRAEAILNSGTPLIFTLAFVFAAGLVAGGARRDYPKTNVRAAGDYYLYFATTGGLWVNLVFLLLMNLALSGESYGLTSFFQTVGPLFWILLWVGFYGLLIWYFARVARSMYKAMQIRPPASEWSLGNKLLVRIHTSFLIMFVMLEVLFLSGAYLVYVLSRRFA